MLNLDFNKPIELELIFITIAFILFITAIGVVLVNQKAKKIEKLRK